MKDRLYEYYQRLNRERLILSVTGPISQEIVTQYGTLLKSVGTISENSRLVVLGVFVEMAQNVLRYSVDKTDGVGLGVVVISETEDSFNVSSGNLISDSHQEKLAKSFSELSSLNSEELRKVYKDRRRQLMDQGSTGAGLGLIELYKRSESVECGFEPVDSGQAFFTVTVSIAKK